MSSRLAFETWQLVLPAIGLGIFAAIFFGVVYRVWRMQPPRVDHLGHLPLEEETPRVNAGLPTASCDTPSERNPVGSSSVRPSRPATHVR